MPPRTNHSSDDRHMQPSISTRLDQGDFDRLETTWRAVKMPSRRQAIIAALREWLDRNEHTEREEQP